MSLQPATRRRLLWGSHLTVLTVGLFLGGWSLWQAVGRGWVPPPPGTPSTLLSPMAGPDAPRESDGASGNATTASASAAAAAPGTTVTPMPEATMAAPVDAGTPVTPVAEATATSAPPAPVAVAAAPPPDAPVAGASLLIPVAGVRASQLVDTFTQSRSEGRTHEAIDIMAPTGTPVYAVADGTVEKLFDSRLGGITLYQFDTAKTRAYYYAHLNAYAAGIVEKQAVKRGDLLGYVGYSGNANPAAPHLHFAIFDLGSERKWWKGTPVNPYPLLSGREPAIARATPTPAKRPLTHRMPEGQVVPTLQDAAKRATDKLPVGVRP